MKPSWKDAPDWANYRVVDADGRWMWFELEPKITLDTWDCSGGRHQMAFLRSEDWEFSLEFRPASEEPWERDK